MTKQFIKFLFMLFLATNVLAGGDDRDNELVESLDAVSNSACSDKEGAVPCADWVVSLDEEALKKKLTDFEADKKRASEKMVTDEIAAFEEALAVEQALIQELAEFEAELAAELELAAEVAAELAAELTTFEAYHSCKARLNLSDANIAKFKAGIAAGSLYNIGPQVASGTDFSANRWSAFFSCQEPTGS